MTPRINRLLPFARPLAVKLRDTYKADIGAIELAQELLPVLDRHTIPKGFRWTEEARKRFYDLWKQGVPRGDIAKELGCSVPSIAVEARRAVAAGLIARRREPRTRKETKQ